MRFSPVGLPYLLFLFTASALAAQAAPSAKAPAPAAISEALIADVHPSPYRATIDYTTNISHQRVDIRHITILDLIEFAYGLGEQDDDRENSAILGGPTWIDLDRYDISAKVPSLNLGSTNPQNFPNDQIRPILKRILAERFHLKYHTEDRPLPSYMVTVAKGSPRLSVAKNQAAASECHHEQDKADLEQQTLTCTSQTMSEFIASIADAFPHPVVDHTGLNSRYDFTLKLAIGPQVHTRDDLARIYAAAFARQLGIEVSSANTLQPAIVVDTVDRTPTPNPPNIAELVPALPDLEFEVASIRPSTDDEPQAQIRPTGSQITFSSFSLQDLITRASQLPTGAMLGNALPLLPRTRFTILVKLPPDIDGRTVYQNRDQIDSMLRKLLIDRFQVRYHWGEWTQPDAYVLLAGSPKMKKANPNSRSFCKYGPPEGEKSARGGTSPFDREFHCQNVTMAQFADLVQPLAQSDVKNRVPDRTGLAGAYDFTVYFTAGRILRAQIAAAAEEAKRTGDSTAAPVAGIGVEDAFRKQLGLRLEKQPLTLPALVLDHFEQSPTAN